MIDPSISRVKPRFISIFFIIVDIISLILQAVGGALSVVSTAQEDIDTGVDISLAGLIFQVVTLIGFVALFADYILSCRRKLQSFQEIRHTMGFFLLSLFICIILILLRCAYRIAELQEGYFSELFREEDLFIALESSVMCLAVGCLNLGHPGPVLGPKLHKKTSEIELTGDKN
ncbi:hypothetical protein ZTR_04587 [Talaromyces verruculosus]|nr:hypothetical protein ZTR_04587 [Talaromyces verruculosus]